MSEQRRERGVDMIDPEERKAAGLMPMHPAILRMRRRRRWRRIAAWEASCAVVVACVEFGMPGGPGAWAPWHVRVWVYGMCMVPVLALNLWFLPRDRARARAFELEWERAPDSNLEDVVAFDGASARIARQQIEQRDDGRHALVLRLLVVAFCFGCASWLVYDRPGEADVWEVMEVAGIVAGVVGLMLLPGVVMRYVTARGALYRIGKERRELLLIREHLPGEGAARAGGLSRVEEVEVMDGAVSVVEERESAR